MNDPTAKDPARQRKCAVYTRKSSERGLDQDFNSLMAQQAVCSAYIQSQAHKGWTQLPKLYEDAARSGATLERPAMQELLEDIERGQVDVVVVYKLDRLSRSLLDFVRLLEVFDRYAVSFVCITQNFDTGDSLGRLVMNVLLTFAQFEREMTGDRIRDKHRAMAMKGLWTGGRPPLGYDLVGHHLIVNRAEAAIVRRIYALYLADPNLTEVARACRRLGHRSKSYVPIKGAPHSSVPLSAASVRKILMNPVYAGFVPAAGKTFRGIHQPIVSEEEWEKAAQLRDEQAERRAALAPKEVLDGLMYDCFGRSMTANRLVKSGRLHVHYRSNQNGWGVRNGIKRMRSNSAETEALVVSALRKLLCDRAELRTLLTRLGRSMRELAAACRKAPAASRRIEGLGRDQLRSLLHALIVRIEVSREAIKLVTRPLEVEQLLHWDFIGLFPRRTEDTGRSATHLIEIPCAGAVRLERYVRLPIEAGTPSARRVDKALRKLIADARNAWSAVQSNRSLSPEEIARNSGASLSHFMRLIRLNYLAPDIVTSILDGRQPSGLTRRQLIDADLPLDWALQRKLFGFPEQPPMRTSEQAY